MKKAKRSSGILTVEGLKGSLGCGFGRVSTLMQHPVCISAKNSETFRDVNVRVSKGANFNRTCLFTTIQCRTHYADSMSPNRSGAEPCEFRAKGSINYVANTSDDRAINTYKKTGRVLVMLSDQQQPPEPARGVNSAKESNATESSGPVSGVS